MTNSRTRHLLLPLLLLLLAAAACREDEVVVPMESEALPVPADPSASPKGLYILNEGNMGSNKSTIDYLDFRSASYYRNIYSELNPSAVKELGDVGNDIAIYGSRVYAVINCSHKVEVLDAATGIRIGQVDIPNCRYITFSGDKAYVSSYVAPVQPDPSAPRGAVYRIDLATLRVDERVTVGYQPEEMAIAGDYLYVANSGGYRAPNYDNTLSVIHLPDFREVEQIPVGPNLHRVKKDRLGRLWVSSRSSDDGKVESRIYVVSPDARTGRMHTTDTLAIPCAGMAIRGDSLFCYSRTRPDRPTADYTIVDIRTLRALTDCFITDGTEADITMPYGIALHPSNGDIYITDAKNYVSSGTLRCYSRSGRLRWSVRTGDIPAHIAFHQE